MQRFRRIFGRAFPYNKSFHVLLQGSFRGLPGNFAFLTAALLVCLHLAGAAAAQPRPAWESNLDGEALVLRPLEGTARFEILQHQVDRSSFRFGAGAERIALRCPPGNSAPLGFTLPPAPVIDELRVGVWVLCNRPGAQLAATVVLPRSTDPETSQPRALLVRGSHLGQGGQWEQLTLAGLPAALARMARVARTQTPAPIDEHEAFVTQVVLLAPGGPGVTELLVDRVEVFGVIGNPQSDARIAAGQPSVRPENSPPDRRSVAAPPRVPRIIRWQGESFELLARLGFQAVGMNRLPTSDELAEARRLGLSLVCPPPTPRQITDEGIPSELDPVLAWDLGDQLSAGDLDQMVHWQQMIKRYDAREGRPTVLAPQLFTREASRIADVVLLDRPMLGTGLTLSDYATWLTHRSRLARPGTPFWTRVDTQLSPRQAAQVAALGTGSGTSAVASYLQMASFTSAAIGVKSQGFYFDSDSSLAERDEATLERSQALELMNLRLGLMEPWLASGKMLASARSTESRLTALVLQAERSHLLVPIWWSDNLQSVSAPPVAGPLSFVVPGVAESSEAYLLTLGGPQRLRHQRVTGGVRISLERLPADGLVLLTDDPAAFSQVARYLRSCAPRATQLRRNLSAMHWQAAARVYPAVPDQTVSQDELQATLAMAKRSLAECDQYAASRNYEAAYHEADALEQALAASDHGLWRATTAGQTVAENPLALGVATLPDLVRVNGLLAGAPTGANLLPRGGFENLAQLLEAGWRHQQLPIEGIVTAVRLSPDAPYRGAFCLELEASSVDPETPAPVVPSSPVWVTSQPVRVHAGDLIEITGQARVPEELLGTVDGLEILDTLGGPELAVHFQSAPSWQPFRMIRAATADADVTVTIALTGLGRAQVDDIALRTIQQGRPLAVSQ